MSKDDDTKFTTPPVVFVLEEQIEKLKKQVEELQKKIEKSDTKKGMSEYETPKILKVNKDEHLFVLLDSNHHDKETMEKFRKQLENKFPKLNNRVLI
jgi:hypothetical protein